MRTSGDVPTFAKGDKVLCVGDAEDWGLVGRVGVVKKVEPRGDCFVDFGEDASYAFMFKEELVSSKQDTLAFIKKHDGRE